MKINPDKFLKSLLAAVLCVSGQAWAFDSGSTGADGAFSPTSNTTLSLPPSGIFNFTTVNIPQGVTVTFGRNAANSPAVILAQGDVVIDGIIDVSGVNGGTISVSPPGGFDGGRSAGPNSDGANGMGPGAGSGGILPSFQCGGGGAGYGSDAQLDFGSGGCNTNMPLAKSYGSLNLQPLLGGSGGGSGANISTNTGSSGAGGGGGGALLIAVTGTLTVSGQILAKGGNGQNTTSGTQTAGGSGSGGGIRLVSTSLAGSGNIDVQAGTLGVTPSQANTNGSTGGYGRVRLEAEIFNFNGTVLPTAALVATALPQPIFVSNLPAVTITAIDGRTVPTVPSGINDVNLPSSTVNPVTVEFAAVNVPIGDTVRLTITPTIGPIVTVTSTPLTGTLANSTATADVTLPAGASVLSAAVSF